MTAFPKDAYAPSALFEAGIPPEQIPKVLVDPRRAPLAKAKLTMGGRKRTAPTHEYGWGPDINFLLELT